MSYNCVSSLQSLFHSEENGSMDVLITNSDSGRSRQYFKLYIVLCFTLSQVPFQCRLLQC